MSATISETKDTKPLIVGVVGASGRLGGLIADMISDAGFEVRAISGRAAATGTEDVDLANVVAVIVAAPMTSSAFHRRALEAKCHVIDVGIVETTIREALDLGGLAKERSRALVLMAGLAPGLSGLLGMSMAQRYPSATRIEVVLVQSAAGTAGERGVRDMLDMLTDTNLSPITRLGATFQSLDRKHLKVFGLPSPERSLLQPRGSGPEIRYHTVFDKPVMNVTIRGLRIIRRCLPRTYASIRDRVASAKARRAIPNEEKIILGAIAIGADGTNLGVEELTLSSDYEATARVAVTLAQMAMAQDLPSGAGHPAAFTDWSELTGKAFN